MRSDELAALWGDEYRYRGWPGNVRALYGEGGGARVDYSPKLCSSVQRDGCHNPSLSLDRAPVAAARGGAGAAPRFGAHQGCPLAHWHERPLAALLARMGAGEEGGLELARRARARGGGARGCRMVFDALHGGGRGEAGDIEDAAAGLPPARGGWTAPHEWYFRSFELRPAPPQESEQRVWSRL